MSYSGTFTSFKADIYSSSSNAFLVLRLSWLSMWQKSNYIPICEKKKHFKIDDQWWMISGENNKPAFKESQSHGLLENCKYWEVKDGYLSIWIWFILCTHKLAGHINMEQDNTSEIETTWVKS